MTSLIEFVFEKIYIYIRNFFNRDYQTIIQPSGQVLPGILASG